MTSVEDRVPHEPVKQGDTIHSPARSLLRVIGVVVLGVSIPAFGWLNWLIGGDYSFLADTRILPNFIVDAVTPGSAPEQAGLRVGDKIDFRNLNLSQRLVVWGIRVMRPGELVRFTVVRNGVPTTIAVRATREPGAQSHVYRILIKRIPEAIFIIIAALLVLRRPSRMLWGLYLFSVGVVTGFPFILSWSPAWVQLFFWEVFFQIYGIFFAIAGLLLFASRFPGDQALGWRAWIDRAAIPVGIALTSMFLLSDFVQYIWAIPQPVLAQTLWTDVNLAAVPLGTLCLVGGLADAPKDKRQPLKWVSAAFTVYLAVSVYIFIANNLPPLENGWPPAWTRAGFTYDLLWAVEIIVPVTVAYAVLKHRLFDINFIITHAIVLTILTSFVVVIFSLIDWIFVRKLEQTGVGIVAGLVAVTALGFSAHALQRRVDVLVNKTLFKRRYLAEVRLAWVAKELPDAGSLDALDALLIEEPLNAYKLTSAAIFRRGDGSRFTRASAISWPSDHWLQLDAEAPPLSNLHSEAQARRIEWESLSAAQFPVPDAAPVLALPIIIRHKLQAIVFYGPHDGGVDFDPDEIRSINGLLIPARAAYDHLEAESLRMEAEELRRESERSRLEAQQVADDRWLDVADESAPEINPS